VIPFGAGLEKNEARAATLGRYNRPRGSTERTGMSCVLVDHFSRHVVIRLAI
jgi:hypothetical protein